MHESRGLGDVYKRQRLLRFRDDKDAEQCTWREIRKPPGPNDLTVPLLLQQGQTSV